MNHVHIISRVAYHPLEPICVDHVVCVKKAKPLSTSHVDCDIPGGADTAILLVDDLEAGILCGIFVKYGPTSVSRTVVNANALPIRKGLCLNATQTVSQIRRDIVDWHYD
jgi:hypothetical protein